MIHYYFLFSPIEALIASQLEPKAFGMYMAQGSKKGSAEQLMFAEVKGEFGDFFDWDYAKERCVKHPDGQPKTSVYLSIYRVLENIPTDAFMMAYLVTKDGRTLSLEQAPYKDPENWKGYALYKELCPVHPLIVSTLNPRELGEYVISGTEKKLTLPALVFTDIRVIDFNNLENSGNIGSMYDRDLDHLKECIMTLKTGKGTKKTKTVDRSFSSKFTYQIIESGIYIVRGKDIIFFRMPTREELRETAYDWGRSANIF